jgi:beta-mannosidase
MFVPHRVDVGAFIRFGNAANSLEIVFESAYRRGELLRKERGDLVCWNGHPSRVYVRKAQYHYGWDWGPSLITCGPWKPIFLEVYNLSISDVKVETSLSEDLKVGRVRIDIEIRGKKTHLMGRQVLKTELRSPQGDLLHSGEYSSGSTQVKLEIGVDTVQLWNPYPSTEQPLYHLEIQLHEQSSSAIIDRCSKNIGFRRVELIQDPLAEGSTFYFKINNIPTFMGGSNWIPGDNFLTHMTPNRYTRMLDLVVRGNQNMLRVWGGGIYEDDAFYDECDRRGILVWQDFCFACGQYPSDKEFVDSIKAEAIAALKRLRSHPSLAILVGNNEDYQLANEELHHDMSTPEDAWLKTSFGARRTYESILPALVKEYAPWIPYWPGSPFGGEDNNSDRRVGDVHIWNVSAGMLLPYQRYPEVSGRFVSEFGMLSCPGMETIKKYFFGDGDDWHPQSEAFEHHCKALSYEKRMFTCLGENFRISLELEKYVYLTQLLQSEAMGSAFRGWRRKFEGRECGGALVWQVRPFQCLIIIIDTFAKTTRQMIPGPPPVGQLSTTAKGQKLHTTLLLEQWHQLP